MAKRVFNQSFRVRQQLSATSEMIKPRGHINFSHKLGKLGRSSNGQEVFFGTILVLVFHNCVVKDFFWVSDTQQMIGGEMGSRTEISKNTSRTGTGLLGSIPMTKAWKGSHTSTHTTPSELIVLLYRGMPGLIFPESSVGSNQPCKSPSSKKAIQYSSKPTIIWPVPTLGQGW